MSLMKGIREDIKNNAKDSFVVDVVEQNIDTYTGTNGYGDYDMIGVKLPFKQGDKIKTGVLQLKVPQAQSMIRPDEPVDKRTEFEDGIEEYDTKYSFKDVCRESANGAYHLDLGSKFDTHLVSFGDKKPVEFTTKELFDAVNEARAFDKERTLAREAKANSLSADVKSGENEVQATVV